MDEAAADSQADSGKVYPLFTQVYFWHYKEQSFTSIMRFFDNYLYLKGIKIS